MTEYTLEQQKAHRKLWVEALRSGEYKQGKERLRNQSDQFCCLGVLCDVAGLDWYEDHFAWRAGLDGPSSTAPAAARAFVGLRDDCGSRIFGPALVTMNDSGESFADIADIIAREPSGLFAESVKP